MIEHRNAVPARTSATASAPAGIGNLAVGFDVLGQALAAPEDRVTVVASDPGEVVIENISGAVSTLPRDPARNAATAGIARMLAEHQAGFGLRISIEKGISLGSGMGGSAASAVAGVTAAAALLNERLTRGEVLDYALDGEEAATGARHADNVAAAICGGVTLVVPNGQGHVMRRIDTPAGLYSVLVHPHLVIETRASRAALPAKMPLANVTRQLGFLAGFLTACSQGDIDLLRTCLRDEMIEPHREKLLPGFKSVQDAALDAGALGCSISGGGPSVFAWCHGQAVTLTVAEAMVTAFRQADIESEHWISPVDAPGARLLE